MNPAVTIILPTLNERAFIKDCLDSLLAQDYSEIDEVLVVDGGSVDGTRDIVASIGPPVRLVDNPNVTAAAAMNVGLAAARNEVIVRADAHTLYATDFVSRNVEVLEETGAAVVGGPMRPVGVSPFGRAVAAVTSSPFGVGPGRFHYSDQREEVETVYLGAYRRSTVLGAGGYDDKHLQWAAEDQERRWSRERRAGCWAVPSLDVVRGYRYRFLSTGWELAQLPAAWLAVLASHPIGRSPSCRSATGPTGPACGAASGGSSPDDRSTFGRNRGGSSGSA